MNPPKLSSSIVRGKKVLVRADLDIPFGPLAGQKDKRLLNKGNYRLEAILPTLSFLSENNCKTIIIGHKGRPKGEKDNKRSLKETCQDLSKLFGKEIKCVDQILGEKVKAAVKELKEGDFMMLENLRFDPREKENDQVFAKELADLADIYVNDSFSVSHRKHSSIVGIPKYIPGYAGFHFSKEMEMLSQVFEKPKKPVVAIISGSKKSKVEYAKSLAKIADKVLVGGKLPEYFGDDKSIREFDQKEKLIIANLIFDKEDITIHSIERFKEEIKKAKTIVLAGVLGRYEEQGHRQGTKEIFEAVADSDAFKVVGGGDSLIAVEMFSVKDKFDWLSVGGGAMLEFLINKTLPGIEALLH